ncbi:maleylpyruvate isomerase family mycothiol-dependent enzyme [Actinacidiphila acididurans]|uniref:Maleylpyruvate isomerase family mycothiol-dependent enzyme n=1 Tax=Actinacidiphila acididurans TaxID=2784346 RepID=A0ABS2TS85_9ACTN|nr:maleylpyruvate isomerase family mycothiol-dependent enzyme [Actinacidiphila acididurans]MBM9505861.1 maleylpyruvate isomerase family mycothiol-dependent enzyme [Actinacidiphila acididurans]
MTVHSKLQSYIDAWTHSIESINEMVSPLTEGEWSRATECPYWSVRDVVSHIIGFECELLGDPRPIHTLPSDLRHIVDENARYTEVPVDIRRHHTAPEMTSELEYTIIRRSRQLRNESRQPDAVVRAIGGGEITLEDQLWARVFDVWVHEQDLRRALDKPGNLASAGAVMARDHLLRSLPRLVAEDAQAGPGSAVVFDVHGPLEFMRTVRVGADGRGTIDSAVSLGPAVTFVVDWETFLRLMTGRVKRSAVDEDRLKTEGDLKLADEILSRIAVAR